MTIETVLDWQERGVNARILGIPITEHPLTTQDNQPPHSGELLEIWQLKYDAWLFGWWIEDSMRQFDTGINRLLMRSAG
ncbi:CrpP-related protein [Rhizobium panacihumi]|uniref:CrpP-related protein n=1 Tax=Rhizobium panacihumi TaxID=2008450 RepID=UPI003D7AC1DD